MRKIHLLTGLWASVILMLSACADERQDQVKFENLASTNTKSELRVSYYTPAGELIAERTPLSANTEYILEITSDQPAGFKFRKTDGFTFVEPDVNMFDVSTTKRYRIKTNADENIVPFFSAYPILKNDKGDLVKERPQLFLRAAVN